MPVDDWTQSEAWDVLYLGGRRMPGVATVEVDLPGSVEVKKAKGTKEGRVYDHGAEPAKVSVTLQLVPSEMQELEAAIGAVLRPRAKNAVQEPLSIRHPQAALWGIYTVKVGAIKSPSPGDDGTFVLRFDCVEHVERPVAVKKPKEEAKGDWDVDKYRAALKERPSQNDAAQANFSPGAPSPGTGYDSSLPGGNGNEYDPSNSSTG